ncbi:MAG: 5' nucleotidase, NT5C type [Acidimicrobiales bacterium]
MIFGVDLDGVCGDFSTAFRAVVADDLGVDADALPPRSNWDFSEWGIRDEDHFRVVHRRAVLEHRVFREMAVVEGCAEALWRLSDAGVWIRIITHRLYVNWGHHEAVTDTVDWLDRHAIPYRDLCFLGAKPEVDADIYIDDAPHNVTALRDAGNEVIAFAQPYNVDVGGLRASTWEEVESIVLARLVAQGRPVPQALPGMGDGPDRLRRRRSVDPPR